MLMRGKIKRPGGRDMKFRTRITLGYAALALAVSLGLGIFYNMYIVQRSESSAFNHFGILSEQVLNNLDGNIQKMTQVTLSLLSDQEAVQTIRQLSVDMAEPQEHVADIINGKARIKRDLYTAYNLDNFYRVVVFNRFGYIAASATMQERYVDTDRKVSEIPWLDEVTGTKGRSILIGVHPDDWGEEGSEQQVYSLVREIQGDNLGFIEVQMSREDFAEIFAMSDQSIKVIAVKEDGEVLYASEGTDAQQYYDLFSKPSQMLKEKNRVTGEQELISIGESQESGVRLLLIQDRNEAMADMPNAWAAAAGVAVLVFLPSMTFIYFMAERLTRPLQALRKRMEKTQISNLTDEIVIDSRDEDIRALTTAYQNLMFRLDHSLNLEKKLNLLQLQAQFDTLQAQINPHFLYNVLNVISSRGMKDNDEVICEICGRLADMLRYSTNTKTRYASIEEEVTYTEQYLYLIKVRYADKISLDTEMDEGIRAQIVPKTVLQQIVENSINHGFENNTGRMEITLRGFQKDGYWFLSVRDNGQGFREETLKDLNEKFEKTKKSLFEDRSNIELEIGGMGLVNTYARLLLIYSDSLVFELKNTEDGSEVLFGAKMS